MRKSPFRENHFMKTRKPIQHFSRFFYRYWRNQATKVLSRLLVKRFSSAAARTLMGELARVSAHPLRVRAFFHSPDTTMKAPQKGVGLVFENLSFLQNIFPQKSYFNYVKIINFCLKIGGIRVRKINGSATKNSSCELSKQTQLRRGRRVNIPFLVGVSRKTWTLQRDLHNNSYSEIWFPRALPYNQAFAHTDTNILVLFKKANISKIE